MYRFIAVVLIAFIAVDHFALDDFYINATADYLQQLGQQTSSEASQMLGR